LLKSTESYLPPDSWGEKPGFPGSENLALPQAIPSFEAIVAEACGKLESKRARHIISRIQKIEEMLKLMEAELDGYLEKNSLAQRHKGHKGTGAKEL
jgi:hypothetical protein